MSTGSMFMLLALLLIKHFFVDWVLQTDEMALNKGKKPMLLFLHSLEHAVCTFFILLFFTKVNTAIMLGIVELIVHSSLDFFKASKYFLGRYQYPKKSFFVSLGLDQLFHQLTYLAFVWVVLYA